MENDTQVIPTETGYGHWVQQPGKREENRLAAKMELKATTVKAHKRDISKRTKRGTIRNGQSERIVNVSAHSRKGWKGTARCTA